ncbi:phosphoinositide phosphatase SAC2-like isoform X2 [Rhododendron vialii]|uniref:phosphoinositide phosphatase SAC2-like isoform X2 n=1 Tax=Rhododendron vialii TaxID=182163 RepID=UPI00265F9297|nr:phosphoinositide phosphatase SAC2-like isoform X2 [Rhododendron vialii]
MASDNGAKSSSPCLKNFKLYETRSNFYMIGWEKSRKIWRVLKIDRLEPSELNILEDSATYSEVECSDLLRRVHEGNKSTGGLKFVTIYYGIVGFIKFLGAYYMLLITKRRKIGTISGHAIYAITKKEMIPIPHSTIRANMGYSKNENRYKKLLQSVDLTKDFFFSYSYHVMHSVQKNLCHHEAGQVLYENMFVWNEFLTRGIRNHLKNTLWTIALVYGFFKQVKLSVSGRDFKLTLIARRSRHYAGTRYLKRGVNEKGRVANDVETEQIVCEDAPEGCLMQISAVVQNRGSIPLFWSQETSRLNIKPEIILSKKDHEYHATRLHFENLVKRYGNPIIVLSLIKTREKKPRESILRAEFANAIAFINKDLTEENRLKFRHWDLSKYSKSKSTDVLSRLHKVTADALNLTGFFYCQVAAPSCTNGLLNLSFFDEKGDCCIQNLCHIPKDADRETRHDSSGLDAAGNHIVKPPMFQSGVLRTNCIDCLDRTNVAQYAYGLVALGYQLRALGFIESPNIDRDSLLGADLMKLYETMGNTLALQYGGSVAHNKIFSESRGQWKAATQSQEFFTNLQRYYNNAYVDPEKQDAINVFLGHFQPCQGKPALWEMDSDQHYSIGRLSFNFADESSRSILKRSLSEGNILSENNSPMEATDVGQKEDNYNPLPDMTQGGERGLSESTPEISTGERELSYPRYTPSVSSLRIFPQLDRYLEGDPIHLNEHRDSSNCSNFFDEDWLSSSENSSEEEAYERSTLIKAGMSWNSVLTGLETESSASASASGSSMKNSEILAGFSDSFVQWVTNGETMFH